MRSIYPLRPTSKFTTGPERQKFKFSRSRLSPSHTFHFPTIKLANLLSSKIIYIILALILLIGFIFAFVHATRITNINCYTQFGSCPTDLANWTTGYFGNNLLLSWSTIASDIKAQFPIVIESKAEVKDKSTLNLQLVIDQPIAAVTTNRLSQIPLYFLVNKSGILITQSDHNLTPTLVALELNTPLGSKLPASQTQALAIISQLNSVGHLFTAQQLSDETLKIILEPSAVNPISTYLQILFPLDGREMPDRLVSALQLILTQATIEPDRAQIDLRLTQPVIQDLTITITPTPIATVSSVATESGLKR